MRSLIFIGLTLLMLTATLAAQETTSFDPRFQITATGGGIWYNMTAINKYMDYARETGLPSNKLNGAPDLGAEIDLYLSNRVSFGVGMDYIAQNPKADFLYAFGLFPSRVTSDLKVKCTAPYLSAKLHNIDGAWDYSFGVGLAYVLGNVKLKADTAGGSVVDLSIDENGVGAFAVAGASYQFYAPFTFGGQFGYRYYNAGKLDDQSLNLLHTFTGIQDAPELNFSGPFLQASIGVRF